jgi:hypothetical protein
MTEQLLKGRICSNRDFHLRTKIFLAKKTFKKFFFHSDVLYKVLRRGSVDSMSVSYKAVQSLNLNAAPLLRKIRDDEEEMILYE